MSDWYYVDKDRRQQGPLSMDELVRRLADLPPTTEIWGPGLATWTPARDVPAVSGRFTAPGAPPPPRFLPRATSAPVRELAGWPLRVASSLLDFGLIVAIVLPAFLIITALGLVDSRGEPSGVGLALWLLAVLVALGVGVWNNVVREGQTGQTIGRSVVGTRLVSLADGQPIGIGRAFLRRLCHFLDGCCCNLGYLWPLWDPQKQTFADKVMGTIVVRD